MDERAKLGSAFAALLATVVSGFYAFHEARYLAWARTAPGVVTATYEIKGRSSRRSWQNKRLGVVLEYTRADGERITGNDTLPLNSKLAPGDAVVVEYIPGEVRSGRLEGNREYFWAGLFPVALVASGVFVGMLVREANEPYRKKRRPAPPPGPLRR